MIVWTLAAITESGVSTTRHGNLKDALRRFAADFDTGHDRASVLTGDVQEYAGRHRRP